MKNAKRIVPLVMVLITFITLIVYLNVKFVVFRISTICTLLTLSGLLRKTGLDFNLYKKMRNKNNPLFLNGYFRKTYTRSFSELKGLYYCQIYILTQAGIFMLYGIVSIAAAKRWYLFEIFMIVLAWVPLPLTKTIQDNYDNVLTSHLKKSAQTKHRDYFILQRDKVDADVISISFLEFPKLIDTISSSYSQKGYILWNKYLLDDGTEILQYFNDNEQNLRINHIIKCDSYDSKRLIETMNSKVHSFLREYNGSRKKYKHLYLSLIVYTKYTPAIFEIVSHPISQDQYTHQLFAVLCAGKGEVYLPKPQGVYGLKEYDVMKHEMLETLSPFLSMERNPKPLV